MKNYIVIESANYADEFDIEGFKIMQENSKGDILDELLEGRSFPMRCCFGTNKYINYETKDDVSDAISITEIPDEDLKVIRKYFGDSFGLTALL